MKCKETIMLVDDDSAFAVVGCGLNEGHKEKHLCQKLGLDRDGKKKRVRIEW